MSQLRLPPHHKSDRKIVDAEFEDVESDWKETARQYGNRIWTDVVTAGRNIAILAGVMSLGAVAAFAIFGVSDGTNTDDTTPALPSYVPGGGSQLGLAEPLNERAPSRLGDFHPSMLCSDTQVLEEVDSSQRLWLFNLLTEMATEGSYIIPQTGDPIAEGATNAGIAWPKGTQFVSVQETGPDIPTDVIEVRCEGTMEIRGAFKLPDDTWSPVFLTIPKVTFVIQAGAEGFSLDFPYSHIEVERTVFHIAGSTLTLKRMREISRGS